MPEKNSPARTDADAILERAAREAAEKNLNYKGSVEPAEAWQIVRQKNAVVVDVRTPEEYAEGHVPDAVLVSWMTGQPMENNPDFISDAEKALDKDAILLLICKSGRRSAKAAAALSEAGFKTVINISRGFIDPPDKKNPDKVSQGWISSNLPWVKD